MTKKFCSALLMGLFASLFSQAMMAQTIVCVETNLDTFCMKLKEAEAPIATGNFLRYVDSQGYDNTLIHQSVRNGYLMGGKWQSSLEKTPVFTAGGIPNEFSLPNTPYTVAMVTEDGQPNSATSGWRINVADNSESFSKANSGAVFAEVIGTAGKAVVDRLAKLSTHLIKAADNTAFLNQAPLIQIDGQISVDDLVQVKRMYRYDGVESDDFDLGVPALTDLVCMDTNKGELCIKLYDDVPLTTANFLNYVNSGAYDNTVIHRSVSSFVVQGGGYKFVNGAMVAVPSGTPVVDENLHSNTRGTIALAKTAANTGANQWFFNESDANAAQLDQPGANSSAFGPFGALIPSSLAVLDAIALVAPTNQTAALGADFSTVPLINVDGSLTADDFITINRVFQTSRRVPLPQPLLNNIVSMTSYDYLYPDNSGQGTYNVGARFPVRVGGKLYMVVLNSHIYTTDEVTLGLDKDGVRRFDVDTTRIVELKDTGRVAATYDGQTLTLATVRIVNEVYANVVFKLMDSKILQFQLVSYEAL